MLYVCVLDFLGSDVLAQLLDYVRQNEARFEPAEISDGITSRVESYARHSRQLGDLGPFQNAFQAKILAETPRLIADLGMPRFEPAGLEMEIVAHADGAMFHRHIDTFGGVGRMKHSDRLITAVYYFHREPKSFSGGALRLYPFPHVAEGGAIDPTEIEPKQDTLIAFPSWTPHEVLEVRCDSGMFADSRFAINCWIHKARRPRAL